MNWEANIIPGDLLRNELEARSLDECHVPYDRVQRLTEADIKALVAETFDHEEHDYGELSHDYPICSDFSKACAALVFLGCLALGTAVRVAFGVVEYTQHAIHQDGPWKGRRKRHAICWASLEDGRVIYFEPQTGKWMDTPKDCFSLDKFTL